MKAQKVSKPEERKLGSKPVRLYWETGDSDEDVPTKANRYKYDPHIRSILNKTD